MTCQCPAAVYVGAGFSPPLLHLTLPLRALISVAVHTCSQKQKAPNPIGGLFSELFSVLSVLCLLSVSSVLILSFFLSFFFFLTSLPLASRSAPHPAPPKAHPGPHSSSSGFLPHRRSRALPTTRAKLLGAPCPLLRVPRSTPAPLAQSRRKTSSTHQSSSSQFPAPAIRRHTARPPLPPLAGPRRSRGTSAPLPASPAAQGRSSARSAGTGQWRKRWPRCM